MVTAASRLGSALAMAAASVLLLGALFSVTRLAAAQGRLLAGVGVTDITPASGGEFFGYVRPDIRADGVALRLTARTLVLDDGARKLALVTVDLRVPSRRCSARPRRRTRWSRACATGASRTRP